ncbi:hypothetical protein NJT12_05000 [Flavobacterium sp. AC]|uniref:Uncharacterized protein n=1 Tax=Flavobacterium azizsancarii TaxID=2961580 RepID=A0ABT4W8U5_9FLAO|nr:hypothetical protein [Flavobacterium azizsancarii]MDA6068975.1 hypothetical protein [Flavobacterium azizsancarii]
MSIIIFNVGSVPNDGKGDKLRTFAIGTNLNNSWLEANKANLLDGKLSENELPANLPSFLTVSNYSNLLDIQTSDRVIIVRVADDENKGISNAIYYLYPDGTRMWIAANRDN